MTETLSPQDYKVRTGRATALEESIDALAEQFALFLRDYGFEVKVAEYYEIHPNNLFEPEALPCSMLTYRLTGGQEEWPWHQVQINDFDLPSKYSLHELTPDELVLQYVDLYGVTWWHPRWLEFQALREES